MATTTTTGRCPRCNEPWDDHIIPIPAASRFGITNPLCRPPEERKA